MAKVCVDRASEIESAWFVFCDGEIGTKTARDWIIDGEARPKVFFFEVAFLHESFKILLLWQPVVNLAKALRSEITVLE